MILLIKSKNLAPMFFFNYAWIQGMKYKVALMWASLSFQISLVLVEENTLSSLRNVLKAWVQSLCMIVRSI